MEAPHHKYCKCPDCELFAQMQAHFGTNKPEPNTRAGEAQARQLATALMSVEQFTADGNFHPDYLAMLTRPLPQPSDTWRDSQFLVATVSQDGREVGIDHPTDANWDDVLRAHISLRDRINERLAENGNCPFKPQPSELVDLIERLKSHMGKQDPQILLADCREAASELRAQSAQIAKLQADGDKLAGALERSRQGWSNVLELGLLPVQHQSTALGLQEAATQALTEWKDRA